ncbi:MAG: prolipoprotein diacylglyceryl transferase [Bacteroidales bacterium]|nr:prolipoprotein diacylglyceryl transferase [Bacteroidales bacterium]
MGILSVHWNVDPEIFRVGFFALRWYGLLFVSGFILGYWMFTKFCDREKVSRDMLDPLLYTLLLGTLVGARLGHCIFYQPDYYFGSWKGFWEIFAVWKGGLASHGGTIMLFICMIWFARKYGKRYNVDFFWILDHLAIAVAFAATFIRLGNLFNSEIYGDVTNLPWGFVFERRGETEPKHPTQIYEAVSYLLLGIGLVILYLKKLDKVYRGTFIGIFFIVCFGMRFLIEFIKEPQVDFERTMALDMGQILSIPFVLLGIFFLVRAFVRKEPAMAVVKDTKPAKAEPTHYARSLAD